ncbi:MAG: phage tail protein [Thermodesulfobacteriota bacterium]
MRLKMITAAACPEGNRIALAWTNPDPAGFPGIRVVRREKTYPVSAKDGVIVAEGTALATGFNADGEALYSIIDGNLQGETHYYYTLFPYQGEPPAYVFDYHNRCVAMATSACGFGSRMFELLPRIYHRYDTAAPADPAIVPAALSRAGQLRRFLEVPGSMLDLLYSHAVAARNLHNTDSIDGRLLPLLAQWIAWQIDYRLEIDAQRNEIRNAPHLYKTVGLIPTVEATVKRLTNWESRIKEFVHNLFLSNNPEQLNLWALTLDEEGEWQQQESPLSLNFAYEGRPAAVTDDSGVIRLFYHTRKKNRWDIWQKSWRGADGWSASQPMSEGLSLDKHPAAAMQAATLWLFWSSFDERDATWRIRYRRSSGGVWSDTADFGPAGSQRRSPATAVDSGGGLWLFWLEFDAGRWQMKYNRHDGTNWQLDPPALFPQDGGLDARVESEPAALSFTSGGAERLMVLWSQREPGGLAGQTRWSVACRIKDGLDPANSADWGAIQLKAKDTAEVSDSDPLAVANADGTLEIFFSSDLSGSWSLWRTGLDPAILSWGVAEQISNSPYTERYPLPLWLNGERVLLYRANRHLTYSSEVYKATRTLDMRYAGSVSCMAPNIAKNALRGKFTDFQAYTHDVGVGGKMTDSNWYSRQTLGIYLTPDTEDPGLILRNQKLLRGVLHQFLPIQVRYVFVIEPAVYREQIYTYDFPTAENERFIKEEYTDSLTTVSTEVYSGPADSHTDRIPEWRWLRAWSMAYTAGGSVDFAAAPVSTRFRTWHVGVTEGEE